MLERQSFREVAGLRVSNVKLRGVDEVWKKLERVWKRPGILHSEEASNPACIVCSPPCLKLRQVCMACEEHRNDLSCHFRTGQGGLKNQ